MTIQNHPVVQSLMLNTKKYSNKKAVQMKPRFPAVACSENWENENIPLASLFDFEGNELVDITLKMKAGRAAHDLIQEHFADFGYIPEYGVYNDNKEINFIDLAFKKNNDLHIWEIKKSNDIGLTKAKPEVENYKGFAKQSCQVNPELGTNINSTGIIIPANDTITTKTTTKDMFNQTILLTSIKV